MERTLPLEGIRVVDLTIWIQGPLAASMLGDLGAEVIKIEKPGTGDFARGSLRIQNQDVLLPDGRSLAFEVPNRNKKGIAVDLNRPEGREVLYRLVRQSDVMVTNLQPVALRQMGADKETILSHNPEIIYAQASGYGQRGPYSEDPCQDTVGMARSGFMYLNATPQDEPTYPMGLLSDVLSGTMLASGVLAALLAKERMGKTPTVYSSQLISMMWLALYPVAAQANLGAAFPSFDRTNAANPLMSIYRCGDGRWLALGLFIGDRFWHDFCEEVGEPELEFDPRFATDDLRLEHRQELVAVIDRILGSRPSAEWERRFRARGFCCSPVNRYADLLKDPQVECNEYIVPLDNGLKTAALPFELEGINFPRVGAPDFSAHTDAVLQDICGYNWEEVIALKAAEVVW